MAINPHDDYESLAKLLYPSIEASGNVYYGQTRKLAIDELFDKNNNGFESYTNAIRGDDPDYSHGYRECFCWKLGPFNDIILVENHHGFSDLLDLVDIPVIWYKYSLIKKDIKKGIIINNASYNTYETEYELSDPNFVISLNGLLPNGHVYDGRNFFINEENGTYCLYIAFRKAAVYENVDKPLYIEALTDDIKVKLSPSGNNSADPNYRLDTGDYEYEYNGNTYKLTLDSEIDVEAGSRIYFKCIDKPVCISSAYYKFTITSENENAEVAVGGNLASMAKLDDSGLIQQNEYYRLFQENMLITDASRLYIGKIQDACCLGLFHRCTRLKTSPAILPCVELKQYCYNLMFNGCPLESSIILPAAVGAYHCYDTMFGKSTLDNPPPITLCCLLNECNNSYTPNWLHSRSGIIYVLENTVWPTDNSGIPEGFRREDITSTYIEESRESLKDKINNEKYLVTHGTNNKDNGRGDITDPFTLANMERSFDENNNHPMNTYNTDGSFNQEIWGYKTFNSPVQFRNGVYGEDWSVYTFDYGSTSRVSGRSVVISQDTNESASIQIYRSQSAGSNERSIILSSEKPDMYYTDNENTNMYYPSGDTAFVGIRRDSDNDTSITLQADNIYLNGDTHAGNLSILNMPDTIDVGYGIVFDVTGSTIKNAENDDLKIDLINYKYHDNISNYDIENISFSVPLHGYEQPGKIVNCEAKLTSTSDYEYTYEENNEQHAVQRTVTSTISSETEGDYARSRIEAEVDFNTNSTFNTASALVEAVISDNAPTLELSVSDTSAYYNNRLIISNSGFKFEGTIEADDITSTGNIEADSITADNLNTNNITANNVTVNNIIADNWSPSPSAIAGILGGLPSTPDGSTSTEYGKIGSLGLFKIGYYVAAGGYLIPGTDLYPVVITYDNNNMLKVQVRDTPVADAESRWISLTPTVNAQGDNGSNICLAIRWR
jgi:hypothetical protein